MGLGDIAFFRSLLETTVLYPADGVSAVKLMQLAYKEKGLVYIRTTRPKTPVIYKESEKFEVGGSVTFGGESSDKVTVVACGITLHEALKAQTVLKEDGINIRVIDVYSVKPIDEAAIKKAAKETEAIITVEDHYLTGGIGDAVLEVLAQEKTAPVYKLGVSKIPRSGKTDELLEYEGISAKDIVEKVKKILN